MTEVCRRSGAAAPTIVAVLLAGAAWLTGCAQQPAVSGGWQGNASRDQAFRKVIVVGVSPNLDQRCAFEHFLASRLNGATTQAVTSCSVVTKKDPLTRESIDEAIASQHADAVVATLLVAKKSGSEEGGSRDTRGGAYYKATGSGWWDGYYGAYGVPVIYGEFQTSESFTTIKGDVSVETRVFETRGATVVYKVETKAKNLESRDEGLAIVTTSIADRLKKDGIVR